MSSRDSGEPGAAHRRPAPVYPWDRQPNETTRAFALFAEYRDAGPLQRSYAKVAREFGRARSTIIEIAQRNSWVARAAAWDAENELIKRGTQIKDLEGMARRQVLAGQLFMSKGLKRIQALTDEEAGLLSVWEAMRLVEVGLRMERLGRGDPPDLAEPHVEKNAAPRHGATSIEELLRRNPSRVGPVVGVLAELRRLLPDLEDDAAAYSEDEMAEISELVFQPEDPE